MGFFYHDFSGFGSDHCGAKNYEGEIGAWVSAFGKLSAHRDIEIFQQATFECHGTPN